MMAGRKRAITPLPSPSLQQRKDNIIRHCCCRHPFLSKARKKKDDGNCYRLLHNNVRGKKQWRHYCHPLLRNKPRKNKDDDIATVVSFFSNSEKKKTMVATVIFFATNQGKNKMIVAMPLFSSQQSKEKKKDDNSNVIILITTKEI